MKIKKGVLVAWGISLAVTIWIWTGVITQAPDQLQSVAEQNISAPNVRTRIMEAENVSSELTLNGETAARRSSLVRSEATGKIARIMVSKGDQVKTGDLIAVLESYDLPARLKSAKALQEQRRLEYLAARELKNQGFQNAAQLAGALAQYEQAQSQVVSLEFQIEQIEIKAPFDGVINGRMVETGSYIRTGDPIAELIDFSRLLIHAEVSENDINNVRLGQLAQVELINGEIVQATTTFIDSSANPSTRTFEVEFETQGRVKQPLAGSSATVTLPTKTSMAHFISPALLTLDNSGKLGLKIVDEQARVALINVTMLDTSPEGVWISGLPSSAEVITVGQGYVEPGQLVQAVTENE